MQDNLGGQLTILKSQLEELAIAFGEILMPTIRKIVSHIQALVDKFNFLSPATKETIAKVALVAAALGPLLVVVGKTMVGVGKLMQVVSNARRVCPSAFGGNGQCLYQMQQNAVMYLMPIIQTGTDGRYHAADHA